MHVKCSDEQQVCNDFKRIWGKHGLHQTRMPCLQLRKIRNNDSFLTLKNTVTILVNTFIDL